LIQYSTNFTAEFQNWEKTDPVQLFSATIVKEEVNPKSRICQHIRQESSGMDYIVLWLDCDREGENICFEVLDNDHLKQSSNRQQQIFRAKFSAITASDINRAMNSLTTPNQNEARAVDARQELDLKIGVSFTRFQTKFFQGKYGDLDARLISYGPCQTPTLGFCVDRYDQIQRFTPEPFWKIIPIIEHDGRRLRLEWDTGRVFDHEVASMYEKMLKSIKTATIVAVKTSEDKRPRPQGLNTVELLKTASGKLGLGPQTTMHIAERLYISGYISYPRTESTAYPSGFDINGTLKMLQSNDSWGDYVKKLIANGPNKPKKGKDVGDHPPITPTRNASQGDLGGDDWRIYDFIARNFIASVSMDCKLQKKEAQFKIGSETFWCSGRKMIQPGFTEVSKWDVLKGENMIPDFENMKTIPVAEVSLEDGKTSPPDFLTESELIGLMEKHGIGTDASIPVHINNISERNYVTVQSSSRTLVPTKLGVSLIHGYHRIDPEIVLPTVRATIESYIDLIAQGKADYETVVSHSLNIFVEKFKYFVQKISAMDELFEASFSTLDKMGGSKLKTKCGKCKRYMNFIPLKPTRLYCQTCEETYALPQGGSIKLYKEIQCPLDNFELVLFSVGPGQKSYPVCPYCYNNPSLDGAQKGWGCNQCPHPTCINSVVHNGILDCPECEEGTMVLDPASGPKWKADCNLCAYILKLPQNVYKITPSGDHCETCGATLLAVNFNKNDTPLEGGQTLFTGCVRCDELLNSRTEGAFSRAPRRGGFRGRGRGRRGRGRGRGRGGKPSRREKERELLRH